MPAVVLVAVAMAGFGLQRTAGEASPSITSAPSPVQPGADHRARTLRRARTAGFTPRPRLVPRQLAPSQTVPVSAALSPQASAELRRLALDRISDALSSDLSPLVSECWELAEQRTGEPRLVNVALAFRVESIAGGEVMVHEQRIDDEATTPEDDELVQCVVQSTYVLEDIEALAAPVHTTFHFSASRRRHPGGRVLHTSGWTYVADET